MIRLSQIFNQVKFIPPIFKRTMATAAISSYGLNHTMFRIKDPKVSLKFYEDNFGMKLLKALPVSELGFTNYFLAVEGTNTLYNNQPWFDRQGVLELCHNHGTENDDLFKANNGNVEPHRGFGHICFSVDNIEAYCDKLESNGVKFQKKLTDGRQKDIAFALDPDGYWIELVEMKGATKIEGKFDQSYTRFNHTMIRVKDAKKSLDFYQNVLGMSLVDTSEHAGAKFSLYFLTFNREEHTVASQPDKRNREGMLELTWNWGTETDPDFSYHNGNPAPQGFGHLGITVPDVDEAMTELEAKGAKILKRKLDGKMKFIGFVADPDGYMIEILPRAETPEKVLS